MKQTLIPVPRGCFWVVLLRCGHVIGLDRYSYTMICPYCDQVRHTVAARRVLR